MTENWNQDLPKIKFEDNIGFTNFHNEEELISDNEEKIKNGTTNETFSKSEKISLDIEKPNENIVQRITLFLALVFCIIVLPIIYHNVKNYFVFMSSIEKEQPLIVTVKKFTPVDLYTKSEATGEIMPESSVDVVSRVEGYLQKTFFKEGDFVKNEASSWRES